MGEGIGKAQDGRPGREFCFADKDGRLWALGHGVGFTASKVDAKVLCVAQIDEQYIKDG